MCINIFSLFQLCERNWDQVPERRLSFKESLASLNEIYPIKGKQADNMISLVRYFPNFNMTNFSVL